MKAKPPPEPMTLLDVIKHGYFQQVRFLVERGENIDQRDSERRTALMLCAFLEPEVWGVGISRLLIENGGKLYLRDIYGLNAFHYACIYERVELVKVFLKAIDFNLLQGDKQGNTALHYAVRAGNDVIVRLVAQAYMKYRIRFDKQNNDGFTALEEACRCNNRKCVRILDNPEALLDMDNIEANIPLDLRFSSDVDQDTRSIRGSRKSLSRPRSSVMSRPRSSAMSHRSSKSSLLTHTESYYRRSPTIYSYDAHRYRRIEPDIAVPPYEKNNKNIIYLASATDLRNNPEYLFRHLAPAVEESSESSQNLPPTKRPRAKSAFVRRSEILTEKQEHSFSWRTELKRLYVHFQYQCTPSYRDTVHFDPEAYLPNVDKPPLTPAHSEHALFEEEGKTKKGRGKSAVARQGTQESLGHGKGKTPARETPSKSRKISAIGHGGKLTASVDGSLESSSESINSLASSKKSANKDVGGGRQSRTANYKNVADDSYSHVQTPEQASQDQSRLRVINE